MNIKAIIVSAALATSLIAGAAGAQTVTLPNGTSVNGVLGQQTPAPNHNQGRRGERASNRSIVQDRKRLERVIDNLQRDQRDYGGHRAQAVEFLQQARNQLLQAEQYDRQHPGQ